jgi:hypothetical protein
MEMIPFECYVHANAIMWRVMYRELRALMNDGVLSLNPMEINEVYEDMWNTGTLLQSDDALSVLDPEFRPWPKVKEATAESQEFYEVHDRNKAVRLPLPYHTLHFAIADPTPFPFFTSQSSQPRLISQRYAPTKRATILRSTKTC